MRLTRSFGVKTPWRKGFKFPLIELFPVANVPGSRDYGRNPVIAMGVRRNLRMCWHAQHDCVNPRCVRITFEHHSLNPSNSRTAGPGITMLRELTLGGSETLFAKVVRRGARAACGSNLRGVEEVANEGHGVRRTLFHQPMPGARDDRLLNIGRNVSHDHRSEERRVGKECRYEWWLEQR